MPAFVRATHTVELQHALQHCNMYCNMHFSTHCKMHCNMHCNIHSTLKRTSGDASLRVYNTHCNTAIHTATLRHKLQHCNTDCITATNTGKLLRTLQHFNVHCHAATLQHTLQHNTTYCNTAAHTTALQHTLQYCNSFPAMHRAYLKELFHTRKYVMPLVRICDVVQMICITPIDVIRHTLASRFAVVCTHVRSRCRHCLGSECTYMYLDIWYWRMYMGRARSRKRHCHHSEPRQRRYLDFHWVTHSSFAEYNLFYRALLQKRPIILRSLLIVATPYLDFHWVTHSSTCTCDIFQRVCPDVHRKL